MMSKLILALAGTNYSCQLVTPVWSTRHVLCKINTASVLLQVMLLGAAWRKNHIGAMRT